jgi:LEA14-like dessication related protein
MDRESKTMVQSSSFRSSCVRLVSVVLWLALAAWAIGCSPTPPTLKPKTVVVKDVTPAGLELEVTMDAQNPNSITLEARKVKAHVTLAQRVELGEVTVDSKVKLPANKHTDIVVPMTFSWGNLVEVGLLAARQDVIPFTVEGTANIGGSSFNVDVPFTIEGTLTRAQLVVLTARSLPKLHL